MATATTRRKASLSSAERLIVVIVVYVVVKCGDELVVDAGVEAEQQRLAQNVVEAFLKRREG